MKCEICNKNEATIHIQEITNLGKKKVNLCSECAANHKLPNLDNGEIDLSDILYKLSSEILHSDEHISELPFNVHDDEQIPFNNKQCTSCGWEGTDLKKTGRLGCAECYTVFSDMLENALKDMHRDTIHLGKRPKNNKSGKNEIFARLSVLRKELDECVETEEYEQAALIRDKINDLKKLSQ